MRKALFLLLAALVSCGGNNTSTSRTPASGQAVSQTTIDCSGYQSNLVVPYGISTPTGEALASKNFAKVVAVDSKDGKMKITILPPSGQSNFSTTLLDELTALGYTIKIIACRESPSSVSSGYSTTGVCSTKGPINVVGKASLTSADFVPDGFTALGTKVHATNTSIEISQKPDFIMITAGGLVEQNQVGEFIVAYGTSPYYTGCYTK
jgi:hypothetical protein